MLSHGLRIYRKCSGGGTIVERAPWRDFGLLSYYFALSRASSGGDNPIWNAARNSAAAAAQHLFHYCGYKITAVLISPVSEGGKILVPLGTTVQGSVRRVRKVGLGLAHETAEIELRFDQLVLPGHEPIPIQVRITSVENARESINKRGGIQGIRATSTLSQRASGFVGFLAFGDPIGVIFVTAGSAAILRFSEPEITLPAGTELLAQLAAPVDLPSVEAQTVPPLVTTAEGRQQLGEMVHKLHFRTFTAGKKELPSDLTNLAFIGSADALQRAFAASGWVVVDTLTAQSTYGTIAPSPRIRVTSARRCLSFFSMEVPPITHTPRRSTHSQSVPFAHLDYERDMAGSARVDLLLDP